MWSKLQIAITVKAGTRMDDAIMTLNRFMRGFKRAFSLLSAIVYGSAAVALSARSR